MGKGQELVIRSGADPQHIDHAARLRKPVRCRRKNLNRHREGTDELETEKKTQLSLPRLKLGQLYGVKLPTTCASFFLLLLLPCFSASVHSGDITKL
jgi:hypothetical protein